VKLHHRVILVFRFGGAIPSSIFPILQRFDERQVQSAMFKALSLQLLFGFLASKLVENYYD